MHEYDGVESTYFDTHINAQHFMDACVRTYARKNTIGHHQNMHQGINLKSKKYS
jgi:hypothetical protein